MRNDELAHWGILGMKWGLRRYQNYDGSLTPEGREHYGVGKAREITRSVGTGVAKAGKATGRLGLTIVKNVGRKHIPKVLMNDEQLMSANNRVNLERIYAQNKRDTKNASMGRGRRVVGDILESGVKSLAVRGFNKLGDKMFDTKIDYKYLAKNPDKIKNLDELRGVLAWQQISEELKNQRLDFRDLVANPENITSLSQLKYVSDWVNTSNKLSENQFDLKDLLAHPNKITTLDQARAVSSWKESMDKIKDPNLKRLLDNPDRIKTLDQAKAVSSWKEAMDKIRDDGPNKKSIQYIFNNLDTGKVSASDVAVAVNASKKLEEYFKDVQSKTEVGEDYVLENLKRMNNEFPR